MKSYISIILLLISHWLFYPLNAKDRLIEDSLRTIFYQNEKIDSKQALYLIHELLQTEENNDSAIKYADYLIDYGKEHKEYLYNGYYYRGLAYKNNSLYEKSLEALYKSSKIANDINCDLCLLSSLIAIGEVFTESYNSRDAILYYNKGLEIAKENADSIAIANTHLKIGSEYLELEQYDLAMKNLTQAHKLFKSMENEYGKALCLGKIAKINAERKIFHLAEKKVSEALVILERYEDRKTLSVYYRYLAEIYRDKKNISGALDYAHISLDIASSSNLLPEVRESYLILTELYTIQGDVDNAFEYQSKYILTRDEINREETIRRMAEMQTEYEVAQKQAEVDLLSKKRQAQQYLVTGLIIILLLSIIIFVILFITVRKRKALNQTLLNRKEELQEQRDELEKLNQVKDRFFSIISHDLRGPINVLNGTTLLIRDFINSKNYDELEELTYNMEYSVKKVQNLLDNLLEWAVSQQGEFPFNREQIQMNDVCENVINIFVPMAATKKIGLTYEIEKGAELIYADLNSLMTILRNLISNAIKFTNKGGKVNISCKSTNSHYIIEVSDNGIGISEEKQHDLFKLSDQKSTWGTAREKGLGIGLSLVHEFVRMHNGEIQVKSNPQQGSVFTILLPINKDLHSTDISNKNVRYIER